MTKPTDALRIHPTKASKIRWDAIGCVLVSWSLMYQIPQSVPSSFDFFESNFEVLLTPEVAHKAGMNRMDPINDISPEFEFQSGMVFNEAFSDEVNSLSNQRDFKTEVWFVDATKFYETGGKHSAFLATFSSPRFFCSICNQPTEKRFHD